MYVTNLLVMIVGLDTLNTKGPVAHNLLVRTRSIRGKVLRYKLKEKTPTHRKFLQVGVLTCLHFITLK